MTSGTLVLEIVLTTPDDASGKAAFGDLEQHLKTCTEALSTEIKGRGKFTVSRAHAPAVAGAQDSFALTSKISTRAAENSEAVSTGGVGQQNV